MKVGEERYVEGESLPVLYPGERAVVDVRKWIEIEPGTYKPTDVGWHVGPAPGMKARFLRLRYRFERWIGLAQ